eukprot:s3094_g12.t1
MYPKVQVALAGGQDMQMSLAPTGVIAGDVGAEPIIPTGLVTTALGCQLTWNLDGLQLVHPIHGIMNFEMVDGCPLMSGEDTLKLIQEIEDKRAVKGIPEEITSALVVPLEDPKLIANRRRRKLWKKEGMVAHAFAGPKEGYTLSRALKEVVGDHRRLHEFDVIHGGGENYFRVGGQAYGFMLKLAFDGTLRGWIGGPPCRTRSVLRHQLEAPYCPEAVSLWRTKTAYNLGTQSFHLQGDFGGPTPKPTTLGGSLPLHLPPRRRTKVGSGIHASSGYLHPDLHLPAACQDPQAVVGREHCGRSHTISKRLLNLPASSCQRLLSQAISLAAKSRYPLDVAGPLKVAPDLSKGDAKYLLVGTFTWPARDQEGKEDDEEKWEVEDELPAEAPQIDDPDTDTIEGGIFDDDEEPEAPQPEAKDLGEEVNHLGEEAPLPEGEQEERKDVKVTVQKLVVPVPTRSRSEVICGLLPATQG